MDHFNQSLTRTRKLQQLHVLFATVRIVILLYFMWYVKSVTSVLSIQLKEGKRSRKMLRVEILHRLVVESDVYCQNELRMNRYTFNVLCEMFRDIGGLRGTINMSIQEIVTIFLYTL